VVVSVGAGNALIKNEFLKKPIAEKPNLR